MNFVPRLLEDGSACCTSPTALCPKCASHAARPRHAAALRLVPPPDGYAQAMTRAAERDAILSPHTDPHYEERGTPPDGYAIGLALRRAEQDERGGTK